MAKYNGVAIGAVTSTGGSAAIPVVLYQGATAGTTVITVDLGTNKTSRVTCLRAADQKSLGVDAEAAIRPLFTSDAAFTTAWSSTGAIPLLCTKTAKVPGSVQVLNGSTATTSGTRLTVQLVTRPQWHPDAPGQETSKFAVVLDTATKKISLITCDK